MTTKAEKIFRVRQHYYGFWNQLHAADIPTGRPGYYRDNDAVPYSRLIAEGVGGAASIASLSAPAKFGVPSGPNAMKTSVAHLACYVGTLCDFVGRNKQRVAVCDHFANIVTLAMILDPTFDECDIEMVGSISLGHAFVVVDRLATSSLALVGTQWGEKSFIVDVWQARVCAALGGGEFVGMTSEGVVETPWNWGYSKVATRIVRKMYFASAVRSADRAFARRVLETPNDGWTARGQTLYELLTAVGEAPGAIEPARRSRTTSV